VRPDVIQHVGLHAHGVALGGHLPECRLHRLQPRDEGLAGYRGLALLLGIRLPLQCLDRQRDARL
jgi:hypothetical protein